MTIMRFRPSPMLTPKYAGQEGYSVPWVDLNIMHTISFHAPMILEWM